MPMMKMLIDLSCLILMIASVHIEMSPVRWNYTLGLWVLELKEVIN